MAISMIGPVGLVGHFTSKQDNATFDARYRPHTIHFPPNKVCIQFPELLGVLVEYLNLYWNLIEICKNVF